jgi:peptide chain release factor 3
MDWTQKVAQGRTFAIISHPDAGKTTLTEKLLLFGGAIREAGAVKARRAQAHARSDWMEIEQQRGISVTSTVLQFPYRGYRINLLDTPGHQDFSEDTYRTLLAADSVVMVIDAAKGVEPQTIKLFEVCRMRKIPVFTFFNKLDRESREPWELLDEVEHVLGIETYPMNWPVGMGLAFRGIFDRQRAIFEQFDRQHQKFLHIPYRDLSDLPSDQKADLDDALELLDGAGSRLDRGKVAAGEQSPAFWGSAIANFGVQNFLDYFVDLAPVPMPRLSEDGWIEPTREMFSGFVFKIQANMNPAHRDRVAFVRICSGRFERGMTVIHERSGRTLRLAQPQQFLAEERQIVDEAFPGDIIGLHDPGIFGIGDTLSTQSGVKFVGFPRFSPAHFAEIELKYTLKHKQYQRGIEELSEEGLLQVFRNPNLGPEIYLGVVGPLQFDVLTYRLQHEYGVEVSLRPLVYTMARWTVGSLMPEIGRFDHAKIVADQNHHPVLLVEDQRTLDKIQEKNPGVTFSEVSEVP